MGHPIPQGLSPRLTFWVGRLLSKKKQSPPRLLFSKFSSNHLLLIPTLWNTPAPALKKHPEWHTEPQNLTGLCSSLSKTTTGLDPFSLSPFWVWWRKHRAVPPLLTSCRLCQECRRGNHRPDSTSHSKTGDLLKSKLPGTVTDQN